MYELGTHGIVPCPRLTPFRVALYSQPLEHRPIDLFAAGQATKRGLHRGKFADLAKRRKKVAAARHDKTCESEIDEIVLIITGMKSTRDLPTTSPYIISFLLSFLFSFRVLRRETKFATTAEKILQREEVLVVGAHTSKCLPPGTRSFACSCVCVYRLKRSWQAFVVCGRRRRDPTDDAIISEIESRSLFSRENFWCVVIPSLGTAEFVFIMWRWLIVC